MLGLATVRSLHIFRVLLVACAALASASTALPAQAAGTLSVSARDSLRAAIEQSVVTATWPPLQRATTRLRTAITTPAGRNDAWLHYDLAYALHRRASVMLVEKQADDARVLLEEAVRLAARAGELGAAPEATALEGAVTGQLAGARGGLSAMRLGPRSFRLLDQALEAGPENPRVALLNGISRLNAPRLFGGGAAKGEPELRRAIQLFASDSSRTPQPVWGLADAHLWLGIALRELNRPAEARVEWERALELAPGHRWIVEQLLPALAAPR